MNKLISGAIGVEILLHTNMTKVFLPDVVDLRKKRIKHIEFCYGSNITRTLSGGVLVNPTVLDKCFLTLVEANTQVELIKSIPVKELNTNGNRLFINKMIDMQRSYIDLVGLTPFIDDIDELSIYMLFWFDEPAIWGNIPVNNRTSIQPLEILLTGAKTYFLENINLRNKRFQNLLLSFPAISAQGNDCLGINHLPDKFITLQRNGLQFFHQVPLYIFYQNNLNYQLRLQNIQFDFQNSFIESIDVTVDDLKTVFFNAILDDNFYNK